MERVKLWEFLVSSENTLQQLDSSYQFSSCWPLRANICGFPETFERLKTIKHHFDYYFLISLTEGAHLYTSPPLTGLTALIFTSQIALRFVSGSEMYFSPFRRLS